MTPAAAITHQEEYRKALESVCLVENARGRAIWRQQMTYKTGSEGTLMTAREELLDALAGGAAYVRDIAAAIKASDDYVRRHMASMESDGLVRRVRIDRLRGGAIAWEACR